MPFAITRQDDIPLYLQVTRQIERLVRLGVWEHGRRLPPERQLAETLGVSRNTVSAAYRQLERQGLLIARQGSGTYVAGSPGTEDERTRIEKMLDLVLDEAMDLGISPAEFSELARIRARDREDTLRLVKVAFIECNQEQLDYFTRELEGGSGVAIRRFLLDRVRRDLDTVRAELEDVDLVVTTLFHLDEVQDFLPELDVLGIALDPQIETIVRVARIPAVARVGLVCISAVFAERIQGSLAGAGITLDLAATTTRDPGELALFVRGIDVILVSPGRRQEVSMVAGDREVIEFNYRPDAGSVNLLRSVLLAKRRDADHR